jgi:hypothetical protein
MASSRWRMLMVFVLTVVTLAVLPSASYAQSCKASRNRCLQPGASCSPVDNGFGDKGKCETLGPKGEQECDCVGSGKPPPAYSLTASPLTPAVVTAGASATSTVTITPANGFNGNVTLSCAVTGGGTPAPSCEFQSGTNPLKGGTGSSTLIVQASDQTPRGTYSIWVTGTDENGLPPDNGRHYLTWMVQTAFPQAGVPILETVYVPPIPGAGGLAGTGRVRPLSYSGVLIVQPAESLEFRLANHAPGLDRRATIAASQCGCTTTETG